MFNCKLICTLLLFLIVNVANAQTIDYTKRPVECLYDLTIPLQDGTIKYTAINIPGVLHYKVRLNNGYEVWAVNFKIGLDAIGYNTLYNPEFIDIDKYKCKEI